MSCCESTVVHHSSEEVLSPEKKRREIKRSNFKDKSCWSILGFKREKSPKMRNADNVIVEELKDENEGEISEDECESPFKMMQAINSQNSPFFGKKICLKNDKSQVPLLKSGQSDWEGPFKDESAIIMLLENQDDHQVFGDDKGCSNAENNSESFSFRESPKLLQISKINIHSNSESNGFSLERVIISSTNIHCGEQEDMRNLRIKSETLKEPSENIGPFKNVRTVSSSQKTALKSETGEKIWRNSSRGFPLKEKSQERKKRKRSTSSKSKKKAGSQSFIRVEEPLSINAGHSPVSCKKIESQNLFRILQSQKDPIQEEEETPKFGNRNESKIEF